MQLPIRMMRRDFLRNVKTQEDLDEFIKVFRSSLKEAPATARKVMDQIRATLPRTGGPGRDHVLDIERKKACMFVDV